MEKSKSALPKDGFEGLKENFKADMLSGFLVFLIALPLCIGISKASGFPAMAGIFTAIIGGLIVGPIMGAPLTIKGPAAGLIVIALGAATDLGYKAALATIVVAGIIQILFGLVKAGKLSDFFPASAIHGMLTAIGIMIAAKQIHSILGVEPAAKDPFDLITEIPNSIRHLNPSITLIGVISLLILFGWPALSSKINFLKKIPAALVVLLMSIGLGLVFNLNHPHDYLFNGQTFHIDPTNFLVILDKSLWGSITFPDFTKVFSLTSIQYIVMFALVGSIESLLSNKAIDTLDPYKRKSNMDRDLLALGIGNTLAGFVGGLPMISETVRSSANINNGAKTRWANVFHGLSLLLFVALASSLIGMIPMAALAAMLIFTGYRLASPKEFFKTYKIGPEQLIIFLVTIVTTLATDLLIGIGVGVLAKFVLHLMFGVPFKALFKADVEMKDDGKNHYHFTIKDAAIFSNYLGFRKYFSNLPDRSHVVIDLSQTVVVDHTFMEHLHELEDDLHERGGRVDVVGLDYHKHLSKHPMSTKRMVKIGAGNGVMALTPRQKRLKIYAEENGFSFDARLMTNVAKFSDFPYSRAHRIKFEENVMIRSNEDMKVEISDIFVEEGVRHSKVEYRMTKILIREFNDTLPDFILEEENLIDGIVSDASLKDIDFDSHPEFSKRYLLKGKDERAIRALFTPELLRFFETNETHHIECKNNKLLVYKEQSQISVEELKRCIVFTMNLHKIIHKVKV